MNLLALTATGLRENVRAAIDILKDVDPVTEVESVAEIYLRFITLKASEHDVSILLLLSQLYFDVFLFLFFLLKMITGIQ